MQNEKGQWPKTIKTKHSFSSLSAATSSTHAALSEKNKHLPFCHRENLSLPLNLPPADQCTRQRGSLCSHTRVNKQSNQGSKSVFKNKRQQNFISKHEAVETSSCKDNNALSLAKRKRMVLVIQWWSMAENQFHTPWQACIAVIQLFSKAEISLGMETFLGKNLSI